MDGSGFRAFFTALPWIGGALVLLGLGAGWILAHC